MSGISPGPSSTRDHDLAFADSNAFDEVSLLTVPGWNGSSPEHWQTLWEEEWPQLRRIEQRDWAAPMRSEWLARIDAAVRTAEKPVYFVAHSLGCLAIAHWAAESTRDASRVMGALLVAPPCLTATCPDALSDFGPLPRQSLPFASVLVASRTDPYLTIHEALLLARSWGSTFVDVGDQGHINVDSGHGPWPVGQRLLRRAISGNVPVLDSRSQESSPPGVLHRT